MYVITITRWFVADRVALCVGVHTFTPQQKEGDKAEWPETHFAGIFASSYKKDIFCGQTR
jgi:hypothetical protein